MLEREANRVCATSPVAHDGDDGDLAVTLDSPDQLVFARQPNPHVTFSRGIHRCIGVRSLGPTPDSRGNRVLRVATCVRLQPGTTLARRSGTSSVLDERLIDFAAVI